MNSARQASPLAPARGGAAAGVAERAGPQACLYQSILLLLLSTKDGCPIRTPIPHHNILIPRGPARDNMLYDFSAPPDKVLCSSMSRCSDGCRAHTSAHAPPRGGVLTLAGRPAMALRRPLRARRPRRTSGAACRISQLDIVQHAAEVHGQGRALRSSFSVTV